MQRVRDFGTPEMWTTVLNLDGFEVVDQRHDEVEGVWHFTVLPTVSAGVCPECGKATARRHQTRERSGIRDLPVGASRVELTVRSFQFECTDCQKCFTPSHTALADGTHATERFLQRCAELIRTSDVQNTAAFFGVPERTLQRWYYDYRERCEQSAEHPAEPIRSIGIDELSVKKGGEDSSR